ncbi:MAG: 23S rRNA (cytosine1962-C5)-methyltransferase [Verrucomicrobiales bacterium]
MNFNLPPSPDTDAFRLFDGDSVSVDAFSEHWLVQTRDVEFPDRIQEKAGWKSIWHKRLETEAKRPPERVAGQQLLEPIEAAEHGIRYEIDFQAGYSQGIFLDQRINRSAVRERVQPGDRVLNTFAYTCAFSVVAALGGATGTSVDLSRNYLDWGKRNFARNEIDADEHFFTRGDTFDWLRRWAKTGISFDGIVLDPPTFSRNDKGKVFRVERDFGDLVELALALLNPGGWMLCCTNFRGLSTRDFSETVRAAAGRSAKLESRAMPPEFSGERYLKSIWVEI